MKIRFLLSNWIFYTTIFVIFVVFFSYIHPIVPYDTDDWWFMGIDRPSYPSISSWNPSKIFPERFEPFVSILGGYLIVPLVGDYISGITLTNAIIVSLFIIVYLWLVQKFIELRFPINKLTSHCLMAVFIVFHFLILRTDKENNDYLWYTHDAACYYHYIIPSLLCASMVLWLMRNDICRFKKGRVIALLIPLFYLAICSNLYSSVIIISYIGSVLLLDLKKSRFVNKTFGSWFICFIRRNVPYLVILILWGIVQWYEVNGSRASYSSLHKPFLHCLKVTVLYFYSFRYNLWFLFVAVLALSGAKLIDYWHSKHNIWHIGYWQITILLSLFFSISYLVLLSSRVNPTYIQRSDIIFSYAFFFLLLVIMALAYLCTHIRYIGISMPLLFFFLLFLVNTPGKTFKDVIEEYKPDLQTCINIDREIVQQILDADANGLDSVTINVPTYSKHSYNWPIMVTDYASQYYGHSLYLHNQTKREIKTIFIPTYVIDL